MWQYLDCYTLFPANYCWYFIVCDCSVRVSWFRLSIPQKMHILCQNFAHYFYPPIMSKILPVKSALPYTLVKVLKRGFIKTHGSVSCGPRSWRATPVSILTGRTKTSFSHICISVITYLIGTKFATQLPASQGSLQSKFEGNRSSHFRDTSCQSTQFVFFSSFFFSSSSSPFRTLAKIAITSKRVLRSPWNLAHRKGVQRRILASNLVQIRWMVQELWPIIRVKQDRFVVTPTG